MSFGVYRPKYLSIFLPHKAQNQYDSYALSFLAKKQLDIWAGKHRMTYKPLTIKILLRYLDTMSDQAHLSQLLDAKAL